MLVWYLNHYATLPELGMPGRPYNVARAFIDAGHEAIVFCASFHHLSPQPVGPEMIGRPSEHDGITYYCLPTRSYRGNTLGRLQNMLDYNRGLRGLGRQIQQGRLKPPDIIVSSSPHPLAYAPAFRLVRKYGSALIYEIRDMWPLALVEMTHLHPLNPIILRMSYLEKHACRHADAVVSLLCNARDYMVHRGLSPERFFYIPNGVSAREWATAPTPLPPEYQQHFDEIRKTGKLIVVYAGSHGPPNALDQILDLQRLKLPDRPYHFVLIGDGASKEMLYRRVRKEQIDFVTFLPRMEKTRTRSALMQADVGFIGWKKSAVYQLGISPNKIGDYFMAGKPVLHAVDAGNDPVAEAGAGISTIPYGPVQLDSALRKLAAMNPAEREQMGLRGRQFALDNLEWNILGARYVKLCEDLLREKKR